MAATVEMTNSETNETRWFYTVDAKEFLRAPGNAWAMTGNVKRSGWATSSARGRNRYITPPSKTQAEQIAEGIVAGLAGQFGVGGVGALAAAIEVPEPAADAESAGLPPEDEVPGEAPVAGESATDMLD